MNAVLAKKNKKGETRDVDDDNDEEFNEDQSIDIDTEMIKWLERRG